VVPDPSVLMHRHRRWVRRRLAAGGVAVLTVVAIGIPVLTRTDDANVSIETGARQASPASSIRDRYIPPTTTKRGVATMPVTLPDGRPYTVRYAKGLALAKLGFRPTVEVQALAPQACCTRTLSISYATVDKVYGDRTPTATYPGVDGQPVPYFEGEGLLIQFGPWLVQVPDRADPVNHPDDRLTADQLALWARNLGGHVDEHGFLVLAGGRQLQLTAGAKTSFVLGPAFTSADNLSIGEHWLCTGPGTDSTTPRRFSPTPTGAAAGAAWCDRRTGLHISVVGSRKFVTGVIAGFRIAPFSSRALATRIQLSAPTVAAGSEIAAQVIVVNSTGKALTYSGCGGLFQVALSNDTYTPVIVRLDCLMQIEVPEGETAYPISVSATYTSCTSSEPATGAVPCLPGGTLPPLPTGDYMARLYQIGSDLPAAPPVPVRVVTPG
jgi:hypothetical protein